MRGSGDELNIEDLEAQSFQGRRGGKKSSTNKKGQNNGGFMRGSSAERADSEEENDGGQVNFQKKNQRGDYSDLDRSGGFDKSRSNNKHNSSSKPPLSGRR